MKISPIASEMAGRVPSVIIGGGGGGGGGGDEPFRGARYSKNYKLIMSFRIYIYVARHRYYLLVALMRYVTALLVLYPDPAFRTCDGYAVAVM